MSVATALAAVTALAVAVPAPAAAQTIVPARTSPTRVATVRSMVPVLHFVSEGDRLFTSGGLDSARVRDIVASEMSKAGVTVADSRTADTALELLFVCAGPDAGQVGCSVELRVFTLGRTPTGELETGVQLWGGSRSLYRAGSWTAIAAQAPQIATDMTGELIAAYQRGTPRLTMGPSASRD